ncbi:MAG: tetratricopeptide repeat protein, partial [Chloroflexota bacterium]
MPELSLRAYGKQIDELIEREKLEEAIAHCRHILQIYPKHLDTYRHLGKAYLEAKRYGDAADIFQRVLSAVPDDFVSHIGMAIVREDEGNLDAAIWHMERAFETNPANPAIQQEMKRLIGRRDGLEPHKVRLTRGALARMYSHGELYSQAVVELRSALQEDAERPDLQVLLADIYWQTDQRPEATSISNRILEKLPYCMVANRILAAGLQASDRVEEAAVFHRRIAGLDPYAAFVESAMADPASVEPSAVTVERLEWQPGEPIPSTQRPGWATTLGYEMQQQRSREQGGAELPQTGPLPPWLEPGEPRPFEIEAEAELRQEFEPRGEPGEDTLEALEPEWMPELKAAESTASEDVALDWDAESSPEPSPAPEWMKEQDQAEKFAPEEIAIPDWMQEAGWGESTGEAAERPLSFSDEELGILESGALPPEPAEEAELAPAELPEWIHEIAPLEQEESEPALEDADEGTPSWLAQEPARGESIDREVEPASAEMLEEVESTAGAMFPTAESDGKELPTWITEDSPDATETIVTWLGARRAEPTHLVQAPAEDLPEWLKDTGPLDESRLEAEAPTAELPKLEPSKPEEGAKGPGLELPGWLAAVAVAAAREEPPARQEIPPEEPVISEEQTASTGEARGFGERQTEAREETPDWLKSLAEEGDDTVEIKGVRGANVPDWLREIAEPGSVSSAETTEEAESLEAAPDWLQGIAEEPEPIAQAPQAPDWLAGLADEGPVGIAKGREVEPEPNVPAKIGPEAQAAGEDDAVISWLEELAARQSGAAEVESVLPVETATPILEERMIPEEPEEGLEWLEQLAEQRGLDVDVGLPQQTPEAPVAEEEEFEVGPPALDTAPDWLSRMATQPIPKVTIPGEAPPEEPEAPAWAELDWGAAEEGIIEPTEEVVSIRYGPAEGLVDRTEEVSARDEPRDAPVQKEAERPFEPVGEDQVPEWLVRAAEQVEPSPAPPKVAAGLAAPPAAVPTEDVLIKSPTEPVEAPEAPLRDRRPAEPPVAEPKPIAPPPPARPALSGAEGPAPPVAEPTLVTRKAKPDPAKMLEGSRQALASGDISKAVELYGGLIKRKETLGQVIEDLRI